LSGATRIFLTAPRRSSSAKAELQRQLSQFLEHAPATAAWTLNGFEPDLDLLGGVLAKTDPKLVTTGAVATGLDMWAATTLRQAGLRGVQPHATEPFYVDKKIAEVIPTFEAIDFALGDLNASRAALASTIPKAQLRSLPKATTKIISRLRNLRKQLEVSTTSVLGESRRKQVDVFLADWDRGLELLISTKTFALSADPSKLRKNLPNRWEEFDGDLKNLRGRFPLAVIGALVIVPSDALTSTMPAFIDKMTKLTVPGRPWVNAYDSAAIIVVESWEAGTVSKVNIVNDQLSEDQLTFELQPRHFFQSLLTRLLERAPISEHVAARKLQAQAAGQDPSAIDVSASITEQEDDSSPS
jgi:hypothetical protein